MKMHLNRKSANTDFVQLNERVRNYWEREPCGTADQIVGELPRLSREWFEQIERHRYNVEPMIHSIAQFIRHAGKTVLEVGVGAGTDHLQWARVGARLYGVDLTEAAIETTQSHLRTFGFTSDLQRTDAEKLPFPDEMFDVVYSWGVIHHADRPDRIIAEIKRVLKPGGVFLGMMYGRHSVVGVKLWIRYGLLRWRPWIGLNQVIWDQVESIGTKAYTVPELHQLFGAFRDLQTDSYLTEYDTRRIPPFLTNWFPDSWGWFICLRATK